jgi:superfamily II DNA or RNA helicase
LQLQIPQPGAVITIRERRWRVARVRREGAILRIDVSAVGGRADAHATFLAPFDRFTTRSTTRTGSSVRRDYLRRVRPQRARARIAALIAHADLAGSPLAALTARVALMPHQLEPVMAVLDGARRILIADAVGLGKTIQAAIVIAELRRRRPEARVLVLVPASLRTQWAAELAGRVGIESRMADAATIDRAAVTRTREMSPWTDHAVWIASLDYIKQPHIIDALPVTPWDLVVIDEAHLACGDSERHAAAAHIASRARHVLLLTATPDSGNTHDRAALADLGLLPGLHDPLLIFRRTPRDVHWKSARHVRLHAVRLSEPEERILDALGAFERAALHAGGRRHHNATLLLLSIFRKRALSTAAALSLSLERRLTHLDRADEPDWQQRSLAFDDTSTDEGDTGPAVTMAIGLSAMRERSWLQRLLALAHVAARHEGKMRRLVALLRRTRDAVIIFTEFRDSLDRLRREIAAVTSLAIVHGGQSSSEQESELESFLSGRARVLLATDVASLGLNLQHRARWVVSFDLPWNPARLEQRAGRVDRFGQSRAVHVTLLAARHPVERDLIARLARRVLAARDAFDDGTLLDGALPDEHAMRHLVLTGKNRAHAPSVAPNESGSSAPRSYVAPTALGSTPRTAPLQRCRRWERPARSLARALMRSRQLAGRAPHGPCEGRPLVAPARRFPRMTDGGRHSVAIFSVPLIDRGGALMEARVVAIRIDADARGRLGPLAIVEAARHAAATAMAARARRLAGLARRRIMRDIAREQTLADLALVPLVQRSSQPGLFDRREERRREDAAARAAEVNATLRRRLTALHDATDVRAGHPHLTMLITP